MYCGDLSPWLHGQRWRGWPSQCTLIEIRWDIRWDLIYHVGLNDFLHLLDFSILLGLHKVVMERKWSRLVKWVLNYLMGMYGPCQAPGQGRLAQYGPRLGRSGLDLAGQQAGIQRSGSFYIPTQVHYQHNQQPIPNCLYGEGNTETSIYHWIDNGFSHLSSTLLMQIVDTVNIDWHS